MNAQHAVLTNTYDPAFRTGEVQYAITLHQNYVFDDLRALMTRVLADMRTRVTAKTGTALAARDKLRYVLLGGDEERTMSVPFMSASSIDADSILELIEETLSQYGHIDEETSFALERVSFSYVIAPALMGCTPAASSGAVAANDLPDDVWYKLHSTSIVRLRNTDKLCAARSLVILRSRYESGVLKTLPRNDMRKLCNMRSPVQAAAARALCEGAGLPTDAGVSVFDLQKFGNFMGVQIGVVSFLGSRIIYQTDRPVGAAVTATVPVYYLLQSGGHFEPIVKMNLFTGTRKWCRACSKGYERHHACTSACNVCKTKGCASIAALAAPATGMRPWMACKNCFRFFLSSGVGANGKTCFQNHIDSGACKDWWICRKCDRTFLSYKVKPHNHVCADRWCSSCCAYKSQKHLREECFIKKVPLLPPSTKYIFSDIESMQETGVHVANLVVSRDWDNVQTVHASESEYVTWVLEHGQGHTVVFHNGGGYDLPMIYRYLCTHTKAKSVRTIYNGTKLMLITIGRGKNAIRFVDSLRWIARPLTQFKKMLGLSTEMEKGFFPHWFNTQANAEYVGVVPAVGHFKPSRMTPELRAQFEAWHATEVCRTTPGSVGYEGDWALKAELLRYCDKDVAILREGCMKFRQMFMDISEQKCDPFQYTTIASTCHALYRAEFMPENSIAVLPYFVASTLRKAMYGGRTNARRLFWEQSHAVETAHYKDVTSLYPYVQWSKPYPLGHPKLIGDWNTVRGTETFKFFKRMKASNLQAWQQPEMHVSLLSYYLREGTMAIVQCDVQCPADLFHPVLPSRMANNKLVFDLRTKHEQWFTSVELRKALDVGYVVTRIHKVALWETTTTALFQSYMAKFVKVKQECSGWPDGCETAEQRRVYVDDYACNQGVQLNPSNIVHNPGLREVAKLCMNSLWGKFSQRDNMPQTTLFKEPGPYLECVFSDRHCNVSVVPIHAPDGADAVCPRGMYEVQYRMCDGLQRHSDKVNVSIGLFTTAHARIHLYSALEKLGRQVLYYDTDSVIYVKDARERAHVHLAEGNYLGEFTDELAGRHIVKFVSGGPKNYAYTLDAANAKGATDVVTIKGFCMTRGAALEQLTLPVMEEVVMARGRTKRKITLELPSIVRDKRRKVVKNATKTRSYQFVYDKGVVLDDMSVLPFGHSDVPVAQDEPDGGDESL
jgi:hypothetical protein